MSEKDYDELRRLGTVLHIPTPEQFWAFSVKDQYGNVTHEHKERGHSWVRNAYNMLTSQICEINPNNSTYGAGYINLKDITAAVFSGDYQTGRSGFSVEISGSGYLGGIDSNSNGVIVGTGNTPWTFEDYNLIAAITSGSGAGQLSYQAGTLAKAYNSGTKTYNVTYNRIFNNNSGTSITINEVGIYAKYAYPGNAVMVTRDVLATPVVVAAASTLTATYTIAVTYPA